MYETSDINDDSNLLIKENSDIESIRRFSSRDSIESLASENSICSSILSSTYNESDIKSFFEMSELFNKRNHSLSWSEKISVCFGLLLLSLCLTTSSSMCGGDEIKISVKFVSIQFLAIIFHFIKRTLSYIPICIELKAGKYQSTLSGNWFLQKYKFDHHMQDHNAPENIYSPLLSHDRFYYYSINFVGFHCTNFVTLKDLQMIETTSQSI